MTGLVPASDSESLCDAAVPCVYCGAPIDSAAFTYWSPAKRLVSATCPGCSRRVTVSTPTWRRWGAAIARAPE